MTSPVEQLENEFAARHGFAGAVAAGFGRAALCLALESVGVRGGDVLVPDFVCAQVPEAVQRAGGTPVFVPVASDLSVAPEALRAAITPGTQAAIFVHYFGRPLPDIAALAEICRAAQIPLIEDCALALGAQSIGAHGDAAVFSFTKSDWCYGGGLIASRVPALVERARAGREKTFQDASELIERYGKLRRMDFDANRPELCRQSDAAGRALEITAGFSSGNFYDAGRYDARMPVFAAQRARQMLASLQEVTACREKIAAEIRAALDSRGALLFQPVADPQDSCAFLLFLCESGQAHSWMERAAEEEVTLRLCWPAYQTAHSAHADSLLRWLAEHLLILEVHPDLQRREIEKMTNCLKRLAGM